MAASYAAEHTEDYAGLVLLAAYSTAEITNMDVISLYGSEDGVLNREKYLDYRSNLPKSTEEIIIEVGSHAGFGSYAFQDGDGESLISGEDQVEITADALANFISRIGNRRIKN